MLLAVLAGALEFSMHAGALCCWLWCGADDALHACLCLVVLLLAARVSAMSTLHAFASTLHYACQHCAGGSVDSRATATLSHGLIWMR